MNYTDKQLLRAAQIAYYNINSYAISQVQSSYPVNTNGYTLCDLFNYSEIFRNSIYSNLTASIGVDDFVVNEDTTLSQIFELKDIKDNEAKKVMISDVYKLIDEITTGDLGSWKLVSYIFNDDIGVPGVAGELTSDGWVHENFSISGDGLCAYVFETSDDSAIVAFRGSQPLNGAGDVFSLDFVSDWLSADGGLAIDDDDTLQQQSVYQFIEGYVNSLGYDHYAFAGHSLGGNLAMHAA